MTDSQASLRIPMLVNPGAGGAAAIQSLQADARLQAIEVSPPDMPHAIASSLADGAERILVAGGDGTLAAAAAVLAGQATPMGVIPAGTLNHFARALNIPLDLNAALEVALTGVSTPVDVAAVNDRLFLNTSSAGFYVSFVRSRERLEPWFGYHLASLFAAIQKFVQLRSFVLEFELHGAACRYETPLVFLAVDERDFALPQLGERKESGKKGLHVLIVRHTTRRMLLVMALRTLIRGMRPWSRESEVVSAIVQQCRVRLPCSHRLVAVDGEIIPMPDQLHYTYRRGGLNVILPPGESA